MKLEWDKTNRTHLAQHPDVSEQEIEEVFSGDFIVVAAAVRGGEQRFECVGPTAAGKLLLVVATKRGDAIRPITAYPAEGRRRRLYRQYQTGKAGDE